MRSARSAVLAGECGGRRVIVNSEEQALDAIARVNELDRHVVRASFEPVLLEERFSWIRCGDAAIRPHLFEVREWRTNIVTVGV
jgi:hypothetical protein